MELEVNENKTLELRKVYNGITLVSGAGERMIVWMRDSGFEFEYQGEKYFAKEGYVEPFQYSVRGNELVTQKHVELSSSPQQNNK